MNLLAAALVFSLTHQDSLPRQAAAAASPASPRGTYLDSGAARLVAAARDRRERAERLVTAYQATVTQRIGVGLRALRRDRMLFGQELAARISWQRDGPTRVEVVGARQRVPIALRGDRVPQDLEGSVEWLVIDPSADYLRLAGDDAEGFIHPLSAAGESHYRFASGDTTTISLPDGRQIRMLELRVIPRRAEFRLMSGSLWFDAETHGMVRAVFAPARPFDIELDGDSGDADDVPAVLKPIRAVVRYVTIEYGLYEFRWWMPRFFALDAEAQASVMRVPMRFERVYSDYRVQGGTEPVAGARRPAGSVRRRQPRDSSAAAPSDSVVAAARDSIRRLVRECARAKADSARSALQAERRRRGASIEIEVSMSGGRFEALCRRQFRTDDRWPVDVVVSADSGSLLASPELGPPILDLGDVISERELRNLAGEIGAIPQRPWQFHASLPSGAGELLRYARFNRVEAVSLGLSTGLDLGRFELDGLVRMGTADLVPNGEVGLARPLTWGRLRLAGYRRLAAANPDTKPFGPINSFSGLLLGRDDGEYFRTNGVELTGVPEPTRAPWWRWRLYAERQRAAEVETRASLPHLFDRDQLFRPNIVAARAEQAGLEVGFRADRPLSGSATAGGDLVVHGAAGRFDFARAATTLWTRFSAGRFTLGLEGGAGTSAGRLPVQSLWFLGGPATLRGYDGGVMRGESFWRARAELGNSWPAARLVLFSDAGWAGPRPEFTAGRSLVSVGVGASLLDGLVRLDLARGLRAPKGWRFDLYMDGLF